MLLRQVVMTTLSDFWPLRFCCSCFHPFVFFLVGLGAGLKVNQLAPPTLFPFLLRTSEIFEAALGDWLHPLLRGEAGTGRPKHVEDPCQEMEQGWPRSAQSLHWL